MPTLKKYIPQSEAELHMLIQKELDGIEDGLELLSHEYTSSKGTLDFLCVDSGGRLAIIEVKLHEDENILFQALRYFSDIDKDRYLIASGFDQKHVSPDDSPRIILIAERFSEDVRRLSTLVKPEIELHEYTAVILPDGEKGIIYHPVSLPVTMEPPPEPKTIDELIQYMTNDDLKSTLSEIRQATRNLGKGIQEYATQGYIGYKHTSGRQFAYIKIHRKTFEFGAHIIDENKQLMDYEGILVETGQEDYSQILGKVKTSFINLGGKINE
jgi:hypothetical protein